MRRLVIMILVFVLSVAICHAEEAQTPASQKQFAPRKVEADTNFDGKVDRVEYYDNNGQIMRVEQDTKGTGKINEWVIYKNGVPIRKEKDTNGDGKPDVWIDY